MKEKEGRKSESTRKEGGREKGKETVGRGGDKENKIKGERKARIKKKGENRGKRKMKGREEGWKSGENVR